MAAVFPSSLPGLVEFRLSPAGQRAAAQPPGYVQQRARTRSGWATGQVAWVFTQAELDAFEAWFRDDLHRGAAWCLMRLPITPSSGDPEAPCYSAVRFPRGYGMPTLHRQGLWRVGAAIEIRDRFECATYSPYRGDTILLLNGTGAIDLDSSPLANSLTALGTITLDTVVPFGGLPTYRTLGAGRIDVASPSFVKSQVGSGEFMFEAWLRLIKYPTATYPELGLNAGAAGIGIGSAGSASWNGFVYGGSSYGASNFGTLSLDTWYHVCTMKDDREESFSYLRNYINGVYAGQSSGFLKTDALQSDGGGRLVGYHTTVPADSVHFACAGVRFVKGSRYYLDASPTVSFTPDQPPLTVS